ncbi:MAG TPA: hypothetical protein VNA15_05250 [Candidatus Angelobacter sp.]|nr:hypothetical protein [Candidatus Angelobacter sp.]
MDLFIAMAVHFPRGPKEEAVMMKEMKSFAEVQSKHKGFRHLIVAEVEDKGIIIPFTIWDTQEDALAAGVDIRKYLATFDFKTNQEGPTRAGGVPVLSNSILTTLKITPVVMHSQD